MVKRNESNRSPHPARARAARNQKLMFFGFGVNTDVKKMGSRSSRPFGPRLAAVQVLHLQLRCEELQLEAAHLELGAQQLAAHKAPEVVSCSL